MYNYYTGLVFRVDTVLLGIIILLAIATLVYVGIKERAFRRRSRRLSGIKKNVYELILSGEKINNKACLSVFSGITSQQFLDIATNRNREAVFFNETEQDVLKQCFVSVERVRKIEKIAGDSWSKWRRIEAILSLGYAQAASSLETLKKAINDRDMDISYFSIIALGQIRNIPSAKILLNFLRKHRYHRHKIFSVLETFPAEISEEVIRLAEDTDPQVRAWAVKIISKLKPAQYFKKIEEMALDQSEDVRAAACNCLGEFGRRDARGVLMERLKDDSWLVRVNALKALSHVLGRECIPDVINRINDPSLSVTDTLKGIMVEHIEAASPYIEKFLYGNDEIARRASVEALEVSGYIMKLLKDILAGTDEEKNYAMRLLKGLIISRAHFGIEAALRIFTEEKLKKFLGVIRNIDYQAADYIEKNIVVDTDKPL